MIKLSYKSQYGRNRLFPLDEDLDALFKAFPSVHGTRKCLSLEQVAALEKLGITFLVVSE